MAGTALLMLAIQGLLVFLQPPDVAGFFNWLTVGVTSICIMAALLWWCTAQRGWMLCGAILLQLAAALFFFLVAGVAEYLKQHLIAVPFRLTLFVAAAPMVGALLAWRQFRSYSQILKLERSKGAGCRLEPL